MLLTSKVGETSVFSSKNNSCFHLIFFILVDNQDIHKSMDEFEFWSDLITDYGAICPLASEKYSFTRFPPQFYSDLFNTCR